MVNKKETSGNVLDAFNDGVKSGWNIAVNAMIPGILLAFTVLQFMTITGLIDKMEFIFRPFMGLLGLSGIMAAPLILTYVSLTGALGLVSSLALSGQITGSEVAIALPGILLFGSLLQYSGRVLGAADVPNKYYGWFFGSSTLAGIIGMLLMRLVVWWF